MLIKAFLIVFINFLSECIAIRFVLKVETDNTERQLITHYVIKNKNKKMKLKNLTLYGSTEEVQLLYHKISDKLKGRFYFIP